MNTRDKEITKTLVCIIFFAFHCFIQHFKQINSTSLTVHRGPEYIHWSESPFPSGDGGLGPNIHVTVPCSYTREVFGDEFIYHPVVDIRFRGKPRLNGFQLPTSIFVQQIK